MRTGVVIGCASHRTISSSSLAPRVMVALRHVSHRLSPAVRDRAVINLDQHASAIVQLAMPCDVGRRFVRSWRRLPRQAPVRRGTSCDGAGRQGREGTADRTSRDTQRLICRGDVMLNALDRRDARRRRLRCGTGSLAREGRHRRRRLRLYVFDCGMLTISTEGVTRYHVTPARSR